MKQEVGRLPLRGTASVGLRPEPVPVSAIRRPPHDAVTAAMIEHGIERIVFIPAENVRQWIPDARDSFHAWPFGVTMAENGMGRGDTALEAIQDAVSQMEARQ